MRKALYIGRSNGYNWIMPTMKVLIYFVMVVVVVVVVVFIFVVTEVKP